MLNLTKKGRQRLVRHRVQFKKISRGRNFGEKNVGRIRTFLGEDHRQRQPSDTTSGNGKVAGTAPLSPVRMPYSGISCLFEKFSNFMQMQRRGGTATRRTREREDALRYREFEYPSYFSSPLSIIVEGTVSIVSRRKQGLGTSLAYFS